MRDIILAQLGIGPIWTLREPESLTSDAPLSGDVLSNVEQVGTDDVLTELAPTLLSTPSVQVQTTPIAAEHNAISSMNWNALQATVADCRVCGLCEGRVHTVFGTGDQKARYLFVGEGPGYNENLQGQPFVGIAGQLLDNMLRALGMQRGAATYIANVIKCRPTDAHGKDRPPSADEIAACLPYLQRQIELIQPDLIIALGKTAAVALLNLNLETPVGQLRGKLHHYQNIPLVVTYHPAYLLRKPTEKSKTWADLCLGLSAVQSSRNPH
jgi:uracil-DNA glycosylase